MGTLLEAVWPILPNGSVVEEEQGEIVGCLALFPEWHIEGLWVAPSHRHQFGLARRFLGAVKSVLKHMGICEVWAMSVSRDHGRLCRHLGTPTHLDCQHFAVKVSHG
jgi:Acetyltransferase (GNAT) family